MKKAFKNVTVSDSTAGEETNQRPNHDEKWCAALLAQLTPETMEHVMRYADQRSRRLTRRTGIYNIELAEKLHQEALTDTWFGKHEWNPDRITLAEHLRAVITSQSVILMAHLYGLTKNRRANRA